MERHAVVPGHPRKPVTALSKRKRLVYLWVKSPALDWVTVIPLSLWGFVSVVWDFWVYITEVPPDVRRVVYQACMGVTATLAGLTLTSISILVALIRASISTLDNLLKDGDQVKIGTVFISAIGSLAVAFLASLVALLVDSVTVKGVWVFELLVVISLAVSVLRIMRIVWVLKRFLVLANGA